MEFNVTYFDGNSSKSHEAILKPNSSEWKIIYKNEQDVLNEISWKIKSIKKSGVHTKGLVSFSYGNKFPFQKIESTDNNFIEFVSKLDHKNITNKLDHKIHKSGIKSISILLIAIISFAIGMYFYVIPNVAVSFAKNLNKQQVINFGDYVFRVLSTDLEIQEEKSNKLQEFVDALQTKGEFPIKAYVAKSDELNAFALSGGKFVIYSSLLDKIKTQDQLAALICHEVSHIENRHVLKNISKDLSGAIFISVLFGDINGVTSIIGENAHLFSQLSFTRKLEKEADLFGLEMMRENNLDLDGMPELFQILKDETSIDLPSYLSNHPMLKDRIAYTQEIADAQDEFEENSILKEKWVILKNSLNFEDEEVDENQKHKTNE